jgi:MerR family mercuric resistance operon transcriptional regulator
MRIGKVAEEASVNIQTLRYYERRGLLPSTHRLASGYREYDPATVSLVRFIKNAQGLGFTLREIGELIELRANHSRSQLEVRDLATKKVSEIDRRIRELGTMKDDLSSLVEKCVEECDLTGLTRDCVILDAMDDSKSGNRHVIKRKSPKRRYDVASR